VTEGKDPDGKMFYTVHVTFSGQEWIVYRNEKQFGDLYTNLIDCGVFGIRGQFPKKSRDTSIEWLCNGYTSFLLQLSRERIYIFNDKKATALYTRFIAPCQVGDEKSSDFVMPFKIEAL